MGLAGQSEGGSEGRGRKGWKGKGKKGRGRRRRKKRKGRERVRGLLICCCLVCIRYIFTQKWKSSEKWERPWNTYHVNLMILGGCKVDIGGEGSTFK